jgi:hypothetical protein
MTGSHPDGILRYRGGPDDRPCAQVATYDSPPTPHDKVTSMTEHHHHTLSDSQHHLLSERFKSSLGHSLGQCFPKWEPSGRLSFRAKTSS